MTQYILKDRTTGDNPLPGWRWKSRVGASEARMGVASDRAGWNLKGDPTPEQRAAFFKENDNLEIVEG